MIARHISFLAAAFAIFGCSNASEPNAIGTAVQSSFGSLLAPSARATPRRARNGFLAVSETLAAPETQPVIALFLEERGTEALLTRSGARPGIETWLSADRAALTLAGGTMLLRSSGLGHDLHHADFSETLTLIATGSAGQAQRRHIYLTRDFQQESHSFTCAVRPTGADTLQLGSRAVVTTRFEEACTGPLAEFTNLYWLAAQEQRIVQAVQWVHPQIGMAHLQALNH